MAVRGGIVDVFPAQGNQPVRVDFWGDEVEDVRVFSVATQRSEHPVDEMVAYPARELRPEEQVAAKAAGLLRTEPWAAHAWERISQGRCSQDRVVVAMADRRTDLVDETGAGAISWSRTRPVRWIARDLMEEEAEAGLGLAPTWGEMAPPARAPTLFGDLERAHWRKTSPSHAFSADGTRRPGVHHSLPGCDARDPGSVARTRQAGAAGVATVIAMDGRRQPTAWPGSSPRKASSSSGSTVW